MLLRPLRSLLLTLAGPRNRCPWCGRHSSHRKKHQDCLANGRTCSFCRKTGHFAPVCRSTPPAASDFRIDIGVDTSCNTHSTYLNFSVHPELQPPSANLLRPSWAPLVVKGTLVAHSFHHDERFSCDISFTDGDGTTNLLSRSESVSPGLLQCIPSVCNPPPLVWFQLLYDFFMPTPHGHVTANNRSLLPS